MSLGWREYVVLNDKAASKLPFVTLSCFSRDELSQPLRTIPGAQALDFLGPLGHVGMTAYFVSQRNATSPFGVLIPVDTPRA